MHVPWGMPTGFAILIFGSNLNLCQHDSVILSWDIRQNRMNNYYMLYVHSRGSQRVIVVKKKPACQCRRHRDMGSIPGSGRSPGGGHGNPLQYSCLENPMDEGAWWAIVHRVAKSQTWLMWLNMHTHSSQRTSWSIQ